MKKSYIIIGVVVLLLIIGIIIFSNGNGDSEGSVDQESTQFEQEVSFSLDDLDQLGQELEYDIEDLGGL